MNRIGIFGGTFDPPHKGHLAIAKQAKKQLGLHCVYFVPAYIPPHKQQHSSTMAQHRLKMLKLAVSGKKEFKVSTIELRRRGISYTVDTLKTFKRRFPNAELILIIGADNLAQFNSWKSPKRILKLASLAVYKRKGFRLLLKDSSIDYFLLKGRMLCISSTEIRNRIKMGFPIRGLVPNALIRYINQYSLYSVLTHVSTKRPSHENHRIY
ncbi:MAG: nicotinate-nucleotide adenylyltransferase [Ignavibacteriales bacterium]|nr:nicotinate-nucleotide adenylyltransferase [Ignavibacteriales bacterium]